LIYAVPGFIWAILFGLWFRNRPEDHPWVSAQELAVIHQDALPLAEAAVGKARGSDQAAIPWKALLLNQQMVMICAQQFFRAAGYAFYGTWFPTYLQRVHGVSASESGFLTSMPLIGVIVGGVFAGKIADYVLRKTGSRRIGRQLLGGISPLLTAVTAVLAWWSRDPWIAAWLMTAGAVLGSFTGCCSYAIIIENARPHVAPAFGTMNAIGNLGAAISPVAIGWLATHHGWRPTMLAFGAFYLLCGLGWLGINPTRPFVASSIE
jgi:MFS family permease